MIVITGATGHLGNNFARLLIQEHLPHKILVRSITDAISDLNTITVQGDIFDEEFLHSQVKSSDILVHLAGYIDLTNKHLEECILVNDFGSKTIIDFCYKNNIRLIYTSSVDVIDRDSKQTHIKEPTSFHPEKCQSNYAFTKGQATKYLYNMIETKHMNACIIYPSAIIGIHDYKPSAAGHEIIKALHKNIFFYVNGGYNFVDVQDISKIIKIIVEKNFTGSVIIGGHNVTIKRFYQCINEVLNKKAIYIYIPKWIALFFSQFSKTFSKMMVKAVFDNYNYDLSKMESLFHFRLKTFEDTVEDTTSWFQTYFQKK
ncbi:MAG: NAD-dependent epimerase/dehydratase family protein [Candidatus Izemoplasmatales bacterium]|jgi:dihydroflavonol-4-reductase|nr:NAD-dependent epimerase/dehydratase family protein [Candidatus Izemoplasmatales bacterium]